MTNAPIPHQIPAPGDLEAMEKLPHQESCENCRFFFLLNYPKADSGKCRRKAPEMWPNGDRIWPTVFLDDWCGEWEANGDE